MLLRLGTKTVDVVMGCRGFIEEWGQGENPFNMLTDWVKCDPYM